MTLTAGAGLGLTGGTGGGAGLTAWVLFRAGSGLQGGTGMDGGTGLFGSVSAAAAVEAEDGFFGGCGGGRLGVTVTMSGMQACVAVDAMKVGWLI